MKSSVKKTVKTKENIQALLPKRIFGVKVSNNLIHQIMVCQMSNKRQGNAHTKNRKDVSGGGRKPWRQKGTGRARHGSTRSPIWVGGGVAFGPRNEKIYKKKIPKKMRRKALLMVLSAKAKNNLVFTLDRIKIKEPKTKEITKMIKDWKSNIKDFKKGSILIALPEKDDKIIRASRNIPKLKTVEARELNVLDLLSFKYLILTKESIKVIEKTFTNYQSEEKLKQDKVIN